MGNQLPICAWCGCVLMPEETGCLCFHCLTTPLGKPRTPDHRAPFNVDRTLDGVPAEEES